MSLLSFKDVSEALDAVRLAHTKLNRCCDLVIIDSRSQGQGCVGNCSERVPCERCTAPDPMLWEAIDLVARAGRMLAIRVAINSAEAAAQAAAATLPRALAVINDNLRNKGGARDAF